MGERSQDWHGERGGGLGGGSELRLAGEAKPVLGEGQGGRGEGLRPGGRNKGRRGWVGRAEHRGGGGSEGGSGFEGQLKVNSR